MARVYLDHNATTPLSPAAQAAMQSAMAHAGNPSSVHAEGRAARAMVETAREAVAAMLGTHAARITFTSGGTEANALALSGSDRVVLVSAVEHPSIRAARPEAGVIPVDAEGVVDLAALERLLAVDPRPALVSVMLANNETGVIQPVTDVGRLVHAAGGLLHCDAVQGPGKLPLDVAALGADMLTMSAHKLGGPAGIGALWLRPGLDALPILRGGGQERGLRAGTENWLGIVGFGAAAAGVSERLAEMPRLRDLRDRIEAEVLKAGGVVHGVGAERLANTVCIGLPSVPATTQVMRLDLEGIAVSAGSACSSGTIAPSPVLLAMGLSEEEAGSAIRVSLGPETTEADIERFIGAWTAIARRERGESKVTRALVPDGASRY